MKKKYEVEEINELNKNLLTYRAKFVKMCDIFREYEETNGNPYTYMRKLSNILKYYEDDKQTSGHKKLVEVEGLNFKFEDI